MSKTYDDKANQNSILNIKKGLKRNIKSMKSSVVTKMKLSKIEEYYEDKLA